MSEATPSMEDREPQERVEDLHAQVELLQAENERLRAEYRRARHTGYRRTAAGLAVVGAAAVGGGLLFPAVRDVLFVLGAIGLFSAVLTRYLTPERFVSAETGERVYAAQAETLDALAGQLGLQEISVYVPVGGTPPARLFIPQHQEFSVPGRDALERPLVIGADASERGASLVPTGGGLFREFEQSLVGSLGEAPGMVAEQVADGLVEGFELATDAEVSSNSTEGRVTVEFTGSVYSDADSLDNPLGSLLAVALAQAVSQPVRLETTAGEEALVVTCRWDAAE